jgi:hypothetical protein
MNIALSMLLLFVILLGIRFCWRIVQAKRAIRSAFADSSVAIVKIERVTVFRDCGSIKSAFLSSLCIRDYYTRCRLADGTEQILNVEADFHPITGTLRRTKISSPNTSWVATGDNVLN